MFKTTANTDSGLAEAGDTVNVVREKDSTFTSIDS